MKQLKTDELLIPAMSDEEYKLHEKNIIDARDAIVPWNGTIIDRHARTPQKNWDRRNIYE